MVLVAATTENPSFSVIAPLLSRSVLVALTPLDDAEIADLVDAAVGDERGLAGGFTLAEDARDAPRPDRGRRRPAGADRPRGGRGRRPRHRAARLPPPPTTTA